TIFGAAACEPFGEPSAASSEPLACFLTALLGAGEVVGALATFSAFGGFGFLALADLALATFAEGDAGTFSFFSAGTGFHLRGKDFFVVLVIPTRVQTLHLLTSLGWLSGRGDKGRVIWVRVRLGSSTCFQLLST